MAKTTLTTDWICIATSGFTIDRREISKQDLKDMAESYDPNEYSSMIWLEHYRWQNFGKVLALKTEEKGEETKLYAKISPNSELLRLNNAGQKVFTSVEILPNFNNSGKAYLGGLAITDSPASRGTTELNFSTRGLAKDTILGNPEPFSIQEETTETEKKKFFNTLFNFFNKETNDKKEFDLDQKDKANIGKHSTQEEIEMTEEQLQKFAITVATETAKACAEHFNAQKTPAPTPEEKPQETVSAEEFNALKTQFDEMVQKFNALEHVGVTAIPTGLPQKEENAFKIKETYGF